MTIWRMRTACCIPKATNTQLEYIIHIAFTLKQWLHEQNSMLRYTYIVFFEGKADCRQARLDSISANGYLITLIPQQAIINIAG